MNRTTQHDCVTNHLPFVWVPIKLFMGGCVLITIKLTSNYDVICTVHINNFYFVILILYLIKDIISVLSLDWK